MFTGLIGDIGTVQAIEGATFTIACNIPQSSIELGASIACDGCCLTVAALSPTPPDFQAFGKTCFSVDVSNETLKCTTLGGWAPGRRINLERSLVLGAELGGHIVSGHIDGTTTIAAIEKEGNGLSFTFSAPHSLKQFIASKGSIALDGTSLTVNHVDDNRFHVMIIPHTASKTTWRERVIGDSVNLEVDLLARYVARIRDVS